MLVLDRITRESEGECQFECFALGGDQVDGALCYNLARLKVLYRDRYTVQWLGIIMAVTQRLPLLCPSLGQGVFFMDVGKKAISAGRPLQSHSHRAPGVSIV